MVPIFPDAPGVGVILAEMVTGMRHRLFLNPCPYPHQVTIEVSAALLKTGGNNKHQHSMVHNGARSYG